MNYPRVFPPASVFIFAALAMIVHFAVPIRQVVRGPFRWSGIAFILLGAWITLSADRLFKQNRTTVKPNKPAAVLVRKGPFRFSRNPMYLGMVLALTGLAVLLGSVTPFLAPLAFFLAVDSVYVAVEEKQLTELFGDEYREYKARVRRWV